MSGTLDEALAIVSYSVQVCRQEIPGEGQLKQEIEVEKMAPGFPHAKLKGCRGSIEAPLRYKHILWVEIFLPNMFSVNKKIESLPPVTSRTEPEPKLVFYHANHLNPRD